MTRGLAALALLGIMGIPRIALAQPETTLVREAPSIGAAVSAGWLGRVAAVRASAPVNDRASVDVTVGHISGRGETSSGAQGLSAAAQVRWMRHGRRTGRSGHWIFGVMAQQGVDRTEIRFPGRTIVARETVLNVTPQVGYGWDYLRRDGVRYGLELSTGGNEKGPSQYIQLFVVWGRPTRS